MQSTLVPKTLSLTFRQLLDEAGLSYGDKPGILYTDKNDVSVTKTYNDLRRDSYYAAYRLAFLVGSGVHIGICAKMSYVFFCFLNGILISSNTLIPFQQNMERGKMLDLIRQADITVMLVDRESADRLGSVEGVQIIVLPDEIPACSPVSLGEDDPDRVALIMFTSGTTSSKMKGVMLTHRALITNVHHKEVKKAENQLTLCVLPMHHIFGFACDYLANIKDGAAMVLNGDMENIGENLLRYQPHFLRLVPMMAEGLLRKVKMVQRFHPELTPRQAAETVFGKRIGMITTAGAKLPAYVGAEYDKLGIRIHQGYGMTETGPRIAVPDDDIDPNAAGNIIPVCQTRFAEGELQIKSPCVMLGYYKDEEETAKVFTEDGWFRTGDIGHIEEEKRLYITGRLKNLIIRSDGENVSPEEIEKPFSDHPLIIEVMAYEEKNKIVAEFYPDSAFAEQNGIADIQAYIKHLVFKANKTLSSEKEIQVIKLRNEPFPRTASGKLIRKKLVFQA